MPIELSCPGCGRTLRVADEAAGKQARCPACGHVSRIPAPADVSAGPAASGSPLVGAGASVGRAPPPKPTPPVNPFADAGAGRPSPFGSPGVNPFSDYAGGVETGNPYQAPSAFGYTPPKTYHDRLSSRGRRFGGAMLDSLFMMLAATPGFIMLMAFAESSDDLSMIGLFLMLGGLLAIGIVNWVMITKNGQSIAKRMLGMQIIRIDTGEPPGFVYGVLLRSWVPALINQACNLFGLIDALWIFNEERRCIHDLIAQTVVIDV